MFETGVMLVTGAKGMVGSAVCRILHRYPAKQILTPDRQELDLSNQARVDAYFDKHRPDYVFMVAAKVGGIAANQSDPVGFLSENTRMQLNLFEACHKYKTRKNLFLGSSCIYPRECGTPRSVYIISWCKSNPPIDRSGGSERGRSLTGGRKQR